MSGKSPLTAAAALLCAFASTGAAQSDVAATVTGLTGRVSVMRDSTPWALSPGDQVKPRQVILTGPDGFASFRLADGSTFEVFPNSQITFRDNIGNWQDLVEVWLGRIKVHIQKLSGGRPNNNRVNTPTAIISVRGTIFHVNVEDDGDTTFVAVEEGLVTVRHKWQSGKEVPLLPGESIRVYKHQPLAARRADKGGIGRAIGRAASEGIYEIMLGRQRGPSGGPGVGSSAPTGGGGGVAGDERAPDPPPPPPPPPPR